MSSRRSKLTSIRLCPDVLDAIAEVHAERRAKGLTPLSDSAALQSLALLGGRYRRERGRGLSIEELLQPAPAPSTPVPTAGVAAPPASAVEAEPPRVFRFSQLHADVNTCRRRARINARVAASRLQALAPGLDGRQAFEWLQEGTVPEVGADAKLLHRAAEAYLAELRYTVAEQAG